MKKIQKTICHIVNIKLRGDAINVVINGMHIFTVGQLEMVVLHVQVKY